MPAPTTTDAERSGAALERRARADRHRPRYHFVAPAGWLNDPNGVGQWDGRFHLFYQYNPDTPVHQDIHWGHASSADLVHWVDEPIALTPSPGPDEGGCWSGVLVDDHGTPTLVYSGHTDRQGQRACLAVGDPTLTTWHKDPANPVIADVPAELDAVEFRDHCVWWDDGRWSHLVGSGLRGQGGTALLYRSDDLRSWDYVGPIVVGSATDGDPWTGTVWECVDLFRLGADSDPAPDVLLVSAWSEGTTHHGIYQTGRFDGRHFEVATRHHLDHGLNYFYAAQSFADDAGRRIVFGWLQEGRDVATQVAAGWSGVMSLPRLATLTPTGELHQEPVPEIAILRGPRSHLDPLTLTPGPAWWPAELATSDTGHQLDVEAVIALPAGAGVDLGFLATPDSAEHTLISLRADPGTGTTRLTLDRSTSSLDPGTDARELSGEVPVGPDRLLSIRLLLDRSAVEVFVNGRPLTARVYPTRTDAVGLYLQAHGAPVTVRSIDVWPMRDAFSGPRRTRP